MTKVWEIDKKPSGWKVPEITISVEGKESTIFLTELIKKYKTPVEMISDIASHIDSSFYVEINGIELSQDDASEIQISSVRTVYISTKQKPKAIVESEEKSTVKNVVSVVSDDKLSSSASHKHAGIIGYHKITDKHRNPSAQRAHDKVVGGKKT